MNKVSKKTILLLALIVDIKELAQEILTKYSDEIDDIVMASTKVRGV